MNKLNSADKAVCWEPEQAAKASASVVNGELSQAIKKKCENN